jgi:alkaline phosphatase
MRQLVRVLMTGILVLGMVVAASGRHRAKNVILFLGDGAGPSTLNAASLHGYGKPRALYIQNMPHIALSETSSASN